MNKLWQIGLLLPFAVCGCEPPTAEFAHLPAYDELAEPAKQVVDSQLNEHFGEPNQLVVWQDLPIDFGGTPGKVKAIKDGQIEIAFDEPPGETSDGTKLSFVSGKFSGQTVTVANYDAGTSTVGLAEKLSETASVGDAVLLDPGAEIKFGRRVYLQHCLHCHGVTGDGKGPTAPSLRPRPRDFRQGIFKFRNIDVDDKVASRADIRRTLVEGIPGTYMPSFRLLTDREMSAVTEYVRWLSLRGQFEELVISKLKSEGYSAADWTADKQAKLDRYAKSVLPADLETTWSVYRGLWVNADDPKTEVRPRTPFNAATSDLARWLYEKRDTVSIGKLTDDAENDDGEVILTVQMTRGALPVEGHTLVMLTGQFAGLMHPVDDSDVDDNTIELVETKLAGKTGDWFLTVGTTPSPAVGYLASLGFPIRRHLTEPTRPEKLTTELEKLSIARGRQLYASKTINCRHCHGERYRGDGPKIEELQKRPGQDSETYPKPGLYDEWHHPIKPRDLTRGIYRGGRRPIDLYSRIYAGIKGSGMPPYRAQLIKDGHDLQVWDLVRFVQAVPHE